MVGIEVVDEVSGGVVLDENLVDRLWTILGRLSEQERSCKHECLADAEITSEENNVFKVKGYANLVFKADTLPMSVQERWKCVKGAAATIEAEKLDRVTLLPQTFFELSKGGLVKFVIAEDRSKLAPSYTVVPNGYYLSGEELTPTLKQLTKFVIRNGFESTAVGNIPLLYEENGALAQPPRIAVLDVEKYRDADSNNNEKASEDTERIIRRGLFGLCRHDGIFGLVQPDKLDAMCDAAAEAGFNVKELCDVQLSNATEMCKKKAEKMRNLQKISAEEESFKEVAQDIVNALERESGEKFGEVATFEFQRTQFQLAIRAFKCHDISGIIMKNEKKETEAWVVHLPSRLAKHWRVLPTFGCEREERTPGDGEESILARTRFILNERFIDFARRYEVHGPKFEDGVAL